MVVRNLMVLHCLHVALETSACEIYSQIRYNFDVFFLIVVIYIMSQYWMEMAERNHHVHVRVYLVVVILYQLIVNSFS